MTNWVRFSETPGFPVALIRMYRVSTGMPDRYWYTTICGDVLLIKSAERTPFYVFTMLNRWFCSF